MVASSFEVSAGGLATVLRDFRLVWEDSRRVSEESNTRGRLEGMLIKLIDEKTRRVSERRNCVGINTCLIRH